MAVRILILVTGAGVSSIGDFVYLVALNVLVLQETQSATAVAGLWVMARIAALLVGPWAGSVTDRFSRRKQLIALEITRAALIALLPVATHIGEVYLILVLLGACGTFFGNVFLPYQTLLIPPERRKRVNSIITMLKSGAFIVGPAIAGILLQQGHTALALWFDSASFVISGLSFVLLPNLHPREKSASPITVHALQSDWHESVDFLRRNLFYTALLALNTGIMVCAVTADTQEVVFVQNALHLGQLGYGMMVTVSGAGFVSGSLLLSVIANRVRTEWLIGIGAAISAGGYLVYSLSHSFVWAATGLVVLGLFGTASNVGYTTYTQSALPVERMGRINNVIGPPQQLLSIVFILLGGYWASVYGVRNLMIGMTVPMCIIALLISWLVFIPRNRRHLAAVDQPVQPA